MHKLCLCCYFYTVPDHQAVGQTSSARESYSKRPALTVDLSNVSDGILSECLCKIMVKVKQ